MAFQTTYSTDPAIAYAGQLADSTIPKTVESFVAEAALVVGNLCQRGTTKERQVTALSSLTAAATALSASGLASAATAQTITTFNGAVGTGLISPAQQITLTLNNNANWDATTGTVVYEDPNGNRVSEDFLIPDSGNTTIMTAGAARRIISIYLPAQSGTGGTFTVGTSPVAPVYTTRGHGIALRDSSREPMTTSNQYSQYDSVPVLTKGRAYVQVEAAVNAGDPVYVRAVTSGSDIAGQFGAKAANFGQLMGAKYCTTTSGAGLAIVELG